MGSTLTDLLKNLMDQGYRQMTVIGYKHRGVYIIHALESIEDDSPEYEAFEQENGSITIYKRDSKSNTLTFATSVMK